MIGKKVFVATGFLFVVCLFCVSASLVAIRGLNEYSRIEVAKAARKVGAEPTIEGIGKYIAGSIKTGMSRDQVESILLEIGPLRIERGSLVDLGLTSGPEAFDHLFLELNQLPWGEWEIVACYNNNGKLIRLASADHEAFPSLELSTPN